MLKKNILANYFGQFYMAVIGIILMPMYISYMGAEAYGIVGFYLVLQVWFQLFDFGLTPSMSREVVRYRANLISANQLNNILKVLEILFCILSFLGLILVFEIAGYISEKWLRYEILSVSEVKSSIILMIFIIAIRWIGGLYRGIITGFEEFVWLNSFNVIISTLKFLLVIPFFIFISNKITDFFSLQFFIALVEIFILKTKVFKIMPTIAPGKTSSFSPAILKNLFRFSFAIAVTDFLLAFVMQLDKVVLSKKLLLSDYGYYSLATLLASGIISLSAPMLGVLQPRLSKISFENNSCDFLLLYYKATQLMAALVLSVSLLIAMFSFQILFSWTGSILIAEKIHRAVTVLVLGNGILAIRNLGTAVQFSHGNLKLYICECLAFLLIFIPTLLVLTDSYGMNGAAYAWCLVQMLFFVFWMPLVHLKFLRISHFRWLSSNFIYIALLNLVLLFLERFIMDEFLLWPSNRMLLASLIILFAGFNFLCCSLLSKYLRLILFGFFSKAYLEIKSAFI